MLKNIFVMISACGALLGGTLSYKPTWYRPSDTSSLGKFKDLDVGEVKSYYSGLESGLKGDSLLSSLQTILENGQTELPKSTSSTWTNYVLLDRDWVKDPLTTQEITDQTWKVDNVVCSPLYDETFTFIKANSPGNKVNREHVLPKSYGFGNDSDSTFLPYAATDMLNLHMGEAANNQQGHNNYPYGNVVDKTTSKAIKSTISGNVTGYLGVNKNNIPVYEPMDKDKGDIARSIFYMAARYHTYEANKDNSPALKLSDTPTDVYTNKTTITASETKDNPCEYGILTDLLSWNDSDPVDNHEIHRNNLCYNFVQNNRNPFIDYPSWAKIAFSSTSTEGINLSVSPTQFGEANPTDPITPAKTYTVTFDSIGGSSVSSLTINENGLITKPTNPTREGYTFKGWYKNGTYTAGSEWDFTKDVVTSDITLYAKWESIPFYSLLNNIDYRVVIVIGGLVLLSFVISAVAAKKKKKNKGIKKSNKK